MEAILFIFFSQIFSWKDYGVISFQLNETNVQGCDCV